MTDPSNLGIDVFAFDKNGSVAYSQAVAIPGQGRCCPPGWSCPPLIISGIVLVEVFPSVRPILQVASAPQPKVSWR